MPPPVMNLLVAKIIFFVILSILPDQSTTQAGITNQHMHLSTMIASFSPTTIAPTTEDVRYSEDHITATPAKRDTVIRYLLANKNFIFLRRSGGTMQPMSNNKGVVNKVLQ